MFTYSPLSREKRETRFFRFSPACHLAPDRISLQLRHASLDDDALQYRALSYVWGDAKEKVQIEVNDKQFFVGENLHALLQMLQHHGVDSWLWADAICIQQFDDDEKSWHVQSMCDVFKNAEMVYSWLGPGSEATDVAMNFFSDWGPRALDVGVMEKLWPTDGYMQGSFPTPFQVPRYLNKLNRYFFSEPVFGKSGPTEDAVSLDSELYDMAKFFYDLLHVEGLRETRGKTTMSDLETGITQLLLNEYWHRIWIFQELALAQEVFLLCGRKFTTISYFEAVLEALWKVYHRHFLANSPLRRGFSARFPPNIYPNKAILIRQVFCRGIEVTLGTILVAFADETERPWYRATDPRDIVYGILGLLDNEDRCPFGNVDYKNTTWVDLFTQATRSLIERSLTPITWDFSGGVRTPAELAGQFLYGLGNCLPRPRNQPSELPSWVPDWRDVGVNGLPSGLVPRNPSITYKYFDADKSKKDPHKYHKLFGHVSPMVLQLPGFRVDIVTDVMAYDYQAENVLEKDRPSNWLAHIRDFTGLPENSDIVSLEGEDYVWRLVMQDLTESFLSRRRQTPKYKAEKIRALFCNWRSRNFTLFKTVKGMLGNGIGDVRPGDVVVILCNAHIPFILRPRPQDGDELAADQHHTSDGSESMRSKESMSFTFGGEAWVDGIMRGEFMATEPNEELFDIY